MDDARKLLDRVVVGVDFASVSVAAAGWTAGCLVRDAELVLVHAVGGEERAGGASSASPPLAGAPRAERERAERRLRELRRGLTADFIWCEGREGIPSDTILDVAAEFRADLIVVGAPRSAPGSSDGHPSTVEQLLHRSRLPVIVMAGAPRNHPKRILVLSTAAPRPAAAVQCARALGAPHEAEVVVRPFTCAGPAAHATPGGGSRVAHSDAVSQPDLWQLREDAALWPATDASAPPDLIVVGNRGPFSAEPPFSDERLTDVLRSAHCPVVFVPEPDWKSRA